MISENPGSWYRDFERCVPYLCYGIKNLPDTAKGIDTALQFTFNLVRNADTALYNDEAKK